MFACSGRKRARFVVERQKVRVATAAYVWEDPGDSIAIQISLDVVERLSAAVQEGLGTGPRGIEIGGVLLGRPLPGNGRVVLIDDFGIVPSQHLRGASYTLSPKERENLGEHLARRNPARVVGYFRSHTRPGLYLDQDDFSIISSYFSDQSQVFLVVRPSAEGPAAGGFFFWEEGDLNRRSTYRQFPFDRDVLEGRDSTIGEQPVATRATPSFPAPIPQLAAPAQRRVPQVSWLVVPIIAGLFLLAGLFVSLNRQSKQPHASAPTLASTLRQPDLSLDIERMGDTLQVRWNPNLPTIRRADLGVLWITDGGQQVRRELDPKELASGNTTYVPASQDVNFELQVFTLTGRTAKSVEGEVPIEPAPVAQVAANMPASREELQGEPPAPTSAQRPAATAGRAVPRTLPKRAASNRPPARRSDAPAPVPVTVTRALPHLEMPPALPVAKPQTKLAAVLSNALSPPPAPEAEVSYEAPRASAIRRALRKISSLGASDSDSFVPPSPIRKVAPAIPGRDAQGSVYVKVYIDESGGVSRAQLLTKNSDLAGPSLDAARQWHFSPALKRNTPVPSEMVLHFRFGSEK